MSLQPCVSLGGRPTRHTILLVEDEPFVREATHGILEGAGFEVLTAEDAAAALCIYDKCHQSIDLVVTDMVLPGRTGQELGQDLRNRSADVKVLVTSGYGNAEYEIEDPNARTYFLAKLYSRRTLVEKVESILGTAPLQHAARQVS